ncbi:MAG: hypothetical protein ACOYIJ_00010 [Eubacteriales bacterium]|jgi:hypothetical protein
MNNLQMVELLRALLVEELTEESRVLTFEEAGLLTCDEGLAVRLPDGNEFQITVVQSKFNKEEE